MRNQQGFTLTELVLALVVVGMILTITIPTCLNLYAKQQQKQVITQAISITLESLQNVVSQRVEVKCRGQVVSAITVSDLQLLPETLTTLPSLTVAINTTNNKIRSVSLSFSVATAAEAQRLQQALYTGDDWIVRHGNQLTLTQPILWLDSAVKRMNFNAESGCYG